MPGPLEKHVPAQAPAMDRRGGGLGLGRPGGGNSSGKSIEDENPA